jgi:flagellin
MSGIVLSGSVRQNLLSLQSTAELLATTQNRLSTGKKVNTALDNPTNYFTAAGLDNRASDISNLLDGIGNGVQVLQAPIPASPRYRSWSIPPSRSPTRCYKRPPVIR